MSHDHNEQTDVQTLKMMGTVIGSLILIMFVCIGIALVLT